MLKNILILSRIHKPTGSFLIMAPCLWGLAAAQSNFLNYILFALGAFIMRSFGCIVNDLTDRNFDKKVKRTMNRPLANGSVSITFAFKLMLFYIFLGFIIWLFLAPKAQLIALIGLALCFIYPWMKRITNWPQLFLGFAFNIGVLVAYAHSTHNLTWEIWLLYFSGICWTLSYDTVYAFQDFQDDLKINIKSTTKIAYRNPKVFIVFFMFLCLISLMVWLFTSQNINPLSLTTYLALCMFFMYHICIWQHTNPQSCWQFFRHHSWYGWIILLIILASA